MFRPEHHGARLAADVGTAFHKIHGKGVAPGWLQVAITLKMIFRIFCSFARGGVTERMFRYLPVADKMFPF